MSLGSIASRWIVGNGDCGPHAEAVRDLLDAGDDGGTPPLSYAVEELRASGATPERATRDAAPFTDVDELEPWNRWVLALLVLVGADEVEARRLRAERLGRPTWDPGTWKT
jgi:hypothetical protein